MTRSPVQIRLVAPEKSPVLRCLREVGCFCYTARDRVCTLSVHRKQITRQKVKRIQHYDVSDDITVLFIMQKVKTRSKGMMIYKHYIHRCFFRSLLPVLLLYLPEYRLYIIKAIAVSCKCSGDFLISVFIVKFTQVFLFDKLFEPLTHTVLVRLE